jgi:xanthosine utilization system XapX-like protein
VELPLGELCRACRQDIERRANRAGRLVALASTIVVGIYVLVRMPAEPTLRMVGAASIAIWYLLTYLVVRRVMREYLK